MTPAQLISMRNELESLKAERASRVARGVDVPEWFDNVIRAHEIKLEDAAPGDDNYIGHDAPLGWQGWTIIATVIVAIAAVAYASALR